MYSLFCVSRRKLYNIRQMAKRAIQVITRWQQTLGILFIVSVTRAMPIYLFIYLLRTFASATHIINAKSTTEALYNSCSYLNKKVVNPLRKQLNERVNSLRAGA